jgi:vesicle coat complex subunit
MTMLPTSSSPQSQPQGKVAELRAELQHGSKKDKNHSGKKIALKRIVANMTMSNNDMVALFPDVVNCMNIPSLEVKKMCFLYLVNYARTKPDIALRALPTLVQVRAVYHGQAGEFAKTGSLCRTWKTTTRLYAL